MLLDVGIVHVRIAVQAAEQQYISLAGKKEPEEPTQQLKTTRRGNKLPDVPSQLEFEHVFVVTCYGAYCLT